MKLIRKWFKKEKCTSKTLSRRDAKQLLKIVKKWAMENGADVDGDTLMVYFNLLWGKVEIDQHPRAGLKMK